MSENIASNSKALLGQFLRFDLWADSGPLSTQDASS